jgi:adenylosuccinate synthase
LAAHLKELQDIGAHLQEVGKEIGTTTGRRRRCGWLDLVVMKYSCLINGYDSLNLTKLDVLDDLSELKIAVKYLVDKKELDGFPGSSTSTHLRSCLSELNMSFPADLDLLSKVDVSYVTLPGWRSSIANTSNFNELPDECKRYIEFIESFLGIPISWIGVGPSRENTIKK